MSELISDSEVKEHIRMSMEDYTRKYDKMNKADRVSEALATLKLAAMDIIEIPQFCEG